MTEHTQDKGNNVELHHRIVSIPAGKKASDIVSERHDMVLLIEVAKCNPNGDPDTGNMPRLQPDTLKGLMTDVCLKRKIRNFFSLYNSDGSLRGEEFQEGHHIFISEGAVLQQQIEDPMVRDCAEDIFKKWFLSEFPEGNRQTVKDAISGTKAADGQDKLFKEIAKRYQAAFGGKKKKATAKSGEGSETEDSEQNPPDEGAGKKGKKQAPVLDALDKVLRNSPERRERAWRDALCRTYFDARYFGGVVSTEGPLKGSFYGQIRGPIQFGFAESLDRVLPLDFSITRCASASASEKEKNQQSEGEGEGGEETGNRTMGRKHSVDYGIYRTHIYLSPAFAARTGFTYYDLDNFLFALQQMFRDDTASARPGGMRVVGLIDFQHFTALGNEHAHRLFEMVKVCRTDEAAKREFPQSLADYCGEAPSGTVRKVDEGGKEKALVTAHKIIWEIPECQKKNCVAVQS